MSTERRRWAWFAGLLALGFAYRLVFVFDQVGRIDGDNAVVALMVRHILEGKHYVFFWGQAYMGTLEPYTIAAIAAFAGLDDVVLRLGPLLWGMLYLASFYPLTALTFGRSEALVALGLAALSPPLLAVWSSAPRGGYATMLCLGQATLLLAISLSRESREVRRSALAAALGIVAGLAFWTHLLSVVFIGAAATSLVLRDRRLLFGRLPWVAGFAFVVGSAPLWLANLGDFATFSLVSDAGHGRAPARAAARLLQSYGPALLGVRDVAGAKAMLLPPLGAIVGVALCAAIVWAVARAVGEAVRALRAGRTAIGPEIFVLLALFVVSADVFTRYGTWKTERYLLGIYGAVFPLLAAACVSLARVRPIGLLLAGAAYAAVVGSGAWSLHVALGSPSQNSAYLPEVIDFMTRAGVRYGLAPHSEALVNTYRSGEALILRDFDIGRYPIDEVADWHVEAILVRGDGRETLEGLTALGLDPRIERFERNALLYGFDRRAPEGRPLPKTGWRVTARLAADQAFAAIDGRLDTRWGSRRPQAPGMTFDIDLGGEAAVVGVRLQSGGFKTDAPRGLRIEGLVGGEWQVLGAVAKSQLGLFREGGDVRLQHVATVEVRFEPRRASALRLVQTGADPRYDWSIAELDVFAID